ncbi:hypothetical protein [Streptomyces sp. BE133]|uniref:hypothetical protein n=1 Tax=Streptomyces sp. BE133 TaxID=3002523 RepID=UPI002E7F17F5|nr:hypothetical protein [Streptomyces sp. BE133]
MTWTFTDDVNAFLDAAGASLVARPAENTLVLTVTATLRRGGPHAYGDAAPLLGWWRGADGEVAGTLVQTPPYPPVLTAVALEAVAPLAARHTGRWLTVDTGTRHLHTFRAQLVYVPAVLQRCARSGHCHETGGRGAGRPAGAVRRGGTGCTSWGPAPRRLSLPRVPARHPKVSRGFGASVRPVGGVRLPARYGSGQGAPGPL